MVSRRNYFIIAILMLIILFLFQFSQVYKESENDYTTNEYASIEIPDRDEWQPLSFDINSGDEAPWEDGEYTLFFGDEESDMGSVVTQWARYSKCNLLTLADTSEFSIAQCRLPEFIIVDSAYMDYDRDTEFLINMTDKGVSIVFCSLPEDQVIEKNDELKALMGINYIKDPAVTVEGYKLFSGFLLGGETLYEPTRESDESRQDMNLTIPWYVTAGGTKTYMVGMMDEYYQDYEMKNDYFPAIIWRNSLGNAQVFCVCGDYMSQTSGIGILSSMIYELGNYYVYPVVNAQNTLLVNYPIMSNENDEEFKTIYTRSLDQFQKEVIWPSLVSMAEKYDMQYTCFMSPKYNYTDTAEPSEDMYNSYLQLFHEQGVEVGLSLEHGEETNLLDKLEADTAFYDSIENRYDSTSAFLNIDDFDLLEEAVKTAYVKDVRTIACAEDIQVPILSYLTNDTTLQSLTSNTKHLTYTRDLRLKSIETALGYDNAELNFGSVVWPESESDHWENIYDDMSRALTTYWAPFRTFERTTLTESDQRVRTFLNLDFEQYREDNTVHIDVSGRGDDNCYFILRTHDEKISGMTGGSFDKIEDDAYLLTINSDSADVQLVNTAVLN